MQRACLYLSGLVFPLVFLAATSAAEKSASKKSELAKKVPTKFECRWAYGKITIDGSNKEKAWQDAPWISNFYLPWLGEKVRLARTSTKAKLLWDRQFLYFFAEMEDSDLYAATKERDSRLWEGDVFELFFKPADNKPGYYEFQVNPANARLDMFLPRRGAGGYSRFRKEFPFEFETKVLLQGTLNRWQDKDSGWSVEGRISWKSFIQAGGRPKVGEWWKFALCRYDYSVDFEGPELSTCAPLNSKRFPDFHYFEDYASLKFIGPGSEEWGEHIPRKRPALTTSKVIGTPDPPKPYRVSRAYRKLKLGWPICIERIPGSNHLLVINESWAYAPARLHVVKDDPSVQKSQVLLKFPGVAYDVAFHPDFKENGYVFIGAHNPNHEKGPHCQITRYQMKRTAPFELKSKSAKVIIEWPSDGHNGAAIAFGRDGLLFVTSGDGTVRRDTDLVGQRLDSLRSKVLRINVDEPAPGKAYSVPGDNPFVKYPGARPEIWCYGLRNPWRITVDQKSGQIWVGNNGQDAWEQIYLLEKGANYGWSVYEGSHPFVAERKPGPTPIQKPTFDHPHSEARSLTGGIVYYGSKYPELQRAYLYGDYSTGKIWAAKHDGKKVILHKEIADTMLAITCFATNKEGDIIIADHRLGGGLYRLEKRPPEEKPTAFPKRLSETGLFSSVRKHQLMPGVMPYEINASGWHDGAIIQRYLAIPASTGNGDPTTIAINVDGQRGWNLPNGTVLIQTLSIETRYGKPSSRKRIETRLLTKQEGEWAGYSYLWNDHQTDGVLVGSSGTRKKLAIDSANGKQTKTWHIPSRAECMSCHSRAANFVLGLTTAQMNRDFDYGAFKLNQLSLRESLGHLRSNWLGQARNQWREQVRRKLKAKFGNQRIEAKQLEELVTKKLVPILNTRSQRSAPRSHLLSKPPTEYPSLPDPFDVKNSLDRRARGYLHVNCAHCHVPDGGGNARIILDWNTPLKKSGLINVSPMHGDFGIKSGKLIVPGVPHRSVLLYRLASLGSGRMPRVGSHHVDESGLKLIRQWIAGMAFSKGEQVPSISSLKKLPGEKRQQHLTKLLEETSSALFFFLAMKENQVGPNLTREILDIATTKSPSTVRDLFEGFLPEEQRVQRLGSAPDPERILRLKGDAETGRQLFFSQSMTCSNCHQIGGTGKSLGPNLSKIGGKLGRKELLDSILHPSKRVEDKFATYVVETKRGNFYQGLLLRQSKTKVVLKNTQHQIIRLSAAEVESIARQSTSLMPKLLLKDLTPLEGAHLLEFLSSLK